MKSYLSLIPISAKVHKRQNRMTILCIIMSVLLVSTIFSVSDMTIRGEDSYMKEKHGNWHIRLDGISQGLSEEIKKRPDVEAVGWSESFNSNVDQPYFLGENKATLYGVDSVYITQLANGVKEGAFPQSDSEVMLSSNAKEAIGIQLGETVVLRTPAGEDSFTVSGFGSDDEEYYRGQSYLIGVYLTQGAFQAVMEKNGVAQNPSCYVKFKDASQAAKAKSEFQTQFNLPEDSIQENTAVMALAGKSSRSSVMNFYGIAAILFVLVVLAGALMISGSMNSNVAQRTKFFGMMRCIGASRRQVMTFVQIEALNWCKTAIPVGLVLGLAISWGICALLHYGIGGEFAGVPVFTPSPIGLISGAVTGIVTVLLAARSPARHAARVSPVAAVSGNTDAALSVRHASKFRFGTVEWMLGVHHATASKKSWFLMTASFALSIILFLCFSVGMDFAHQLMPSLSPWQPDLTLNGFANELVLEKDVCDQISAMDGVEHVFGSSYLDNVPAASSRPGVDHVNLVSYSDYLLESSEDSVVEGDISAVSGDSGQVMTVKNKDNPLQVGDSITIDGKEVKITGALSNGLYPSEYSIICSPETFERLTGEKNYNLIGAQLGKNAADDTVRQIAGFAASDVIFADMREENQENNSSYLAVNFIMYCFLGVIAIITLFNIMNSISMSVTARFKQYGAMRAVGMDSGQLVRMVCAEAFTYAVSGLVVGCGLGIPLSYFLHVKLLTRYFGVAWNFPVGLFCITIVFVLVSALAAVRAPSVRINHMTITAAINEL